MRDYTATFTTAFGTANPAGLHLHFADDLVDATLDGQPLKLTTGYDGALATPPALGMGEHVALPYGPRIPREALRLAEGRSHSEESHTVRSRPQPPSAPLVRSLPESRQRRTRPNSPLRVSAINQPLVAEATSRSAPAATLRLASMLGDAARATLDGQPAGWTWGPDWQLTLPQPLAAGSHRLRLELVPSTFNIFGPHHYYNGDWHVVSPGQIIGEKNFADLPDAPNNTHVPEWHFKPLRLPTAVLV